MSLRDLNWRKGFFRLWLLASVIWVIVIGMFVVYPSATRYIESLKSVQEIDHSKDEAKIDIAKIPKEPKELTDDQVASLTVSQNPEIVDLGPLPGFSIYTIRDPQSGKTITFQWILPTPPTHVDMQKDFTIDFIPQKLNLIPVDKITGNKLTADEFLDKKKEKDQIEYVTTEKWYEVNRIAKSKESRKKDLLVCSGMTFLPPVIALVLGIGVMWVFSGFVPKQNK
ncbi:MAG: hypothetical protein ABSF90_30600 [Syntrophobacteraceae bacterium]